jgi:hypothetical protein
LLNEKRGKKSDEGCEWLLDEFLWLGVDEVDLDMGCLRLVGVLKSCEDGNLGKVLEV